MIKKTFFFLLTMVSFSINATNDSIQNVRRQIPKNYKEAYQDKEYVYKEQDPSWLLELKTWLLQKAMFFFKYFNYNEGIEHFKLIFYFIVVVLATYIISKMLLYKEGQWLFKKTKKDNTIIYQDDVKSIEVSDFEKMIKNSLINEDYRLAIKFFYLWSLQKLAKKQYIELSNLKTNYDYQLEMESHSLSEKFKNISYYYTYVWYGEFSIDKNSFEKIEVKYNEFLKELTS